jgi:hypothetical protein
MRLVRHAPMCAALALLIVASPVRADELDEARTMRRHGIGVTIGGTALNVAGIGLLLGSIAAPSCALAVGAPPNSSCGTTHMPSSSAFAPLFVGGIMVSVLGDTMIAIGIWHWRAGARQMKKLQRATAAR